MPKFSDALLRGMLTSTLPEQVYSTAYSMGQAPRVRQARKEEEERNKGILGGTLAAQQMAREGTFTPEVARDFAGSLQGLGVDPNQILERTGQLQELNTRAAQQNRTQNFVKSLGEEYEAQLAAGFSLKDIHSAYLKDAQQGSIVALAQQIDPTISAELAEQMTSKDLMELYESKKEEAGTQAWASWINDNPEINNSNRQEAITAAVAAFGAEAPKKVADLEAKQLEIRAKREGDKSVPVLITMKSNSAFSGLDALGGGKTQITVKNLPVGANGKLSDDAKNWLEAHADSAMVQDTGESWKTSTPKKDLDSGQGGDGTTLSQVAPGLVQSLVNTQMQD